MPRKRHAERTRRPIPHPLRHLADAGLLLPEHVRGRRHAPRKQVLHRRHAHGTLETFEERGA